uniref:Uncharacterized protein n=1 Tax=Solanum tuberosum TaxID=4113 RepID=M1DS82_SOLTU
MININLEEVRRNLLLNITQYEKSDTFMRSETSDDVAEDIQEAQPFVGGNLPHSSEYLLRCTEEEALLWEVLEFIKLILPLCITGELEEDPYDDPGDDLPLPLV